MCKTDGGICVHLGLAVNLKYILEYLIFLVLAPRYMGESLFTIDPKEKNRVVRYSESGKETEAEAETEINA